ncbi:MAG TPA: catalase [Sporichthya sp.]|nr:catalase [Sporichthya sp.]
MSTDVPPVPSAPGVPGSEAPTFAEPTEPRTPPAPKPDQRAPRPVSATGNSPEDFGAELPPTWDSQQETYLTTGQGVRIRETDHSLRAGPRGPTLLNDNHLREKVMHFDHERIPERVVHARGAAAHGTFVANGAAAELTCAAFLQPGAETPTFVRFSTVLGSRGSADTVRDTRGFATKFYTEDGNFDLVGNNIPVFFIQDGIKFPDVVHAAKPHPDREIPQAQSAHDTFWDFVSLHTEATHHTLWNMSDRGIPRSYRTMEGFGVHTFRLVNAEGATCLIKWHWKPRLGVHSLVWEEAQMLAGFDPDFHRRDLYDAIESGAFPEYDLGIQVFEDNAEQTFAGIDLLDPTKLVPEELAPVQIIGTLTLNGNPTNFFAEVEQVAFCTAHLVPGIDVTDDPLLTARNFSYLDTQLTRLGGPNFAQIPINRPHVPVNSMHRDGFHQDAVHGGVAPYKPNSLDGGCPFTANGDVNALIEVARAIPASNIVREKPASFEDHYSQPRLFWLSMTPVEQDHIVAAYTFELSKCYETAIRERALTTLANIDDGLCARVAEGLGLEPPKPSVELVEVELSPALSQLGAEWPVDGRVVGLVVGPTPDLSAVNAARDAALTAGMVPLLVAPAGGKLAADGLVVDVQRTYANARSVEFDAVLIADAMPPAPDALPGLDAKAGAGTSPAVDPRITLLIDETYRHAKAIAGTGAGTEVLTALGAAGRPGVVDAPDAAAAVQELAVLLAAHRAWERVAR